MMASKVFDYSKLSNSELRALTKVFGIDTKGAVEKYELLEKLHLHLQESKKERLEESIGVMNEVYGKYEEGKEWNPKPYQEGKGRYLWTDAYGVCNFITLYHETKDSSYLRRAEILINEVHNVLGKDRSGQNRLGDSTDEEPLRGGLRIGKKDPEGTSDGDGQYYHYLTKWMFALNRMSLATGDKKYNDWAVSLIKSIHPHFVIHRNTQRPRIFWKMNIKLTNPEVPSEGNLDPFDGYITYRIVQSHCSNQNILEGEIADLKKIVDSKYKHYSSDDPLDLGEALWIAHWFKNENWAWQILQTSLSQLDNLWERGYFENPKKFRLGFREFGTTIGIQLAFPQNIEWISRVHALHLFWSKDLYHRDRDITPVMYCTSLTPGVFSSDYHTKESSK